MSSYHILSQTIADLERVVAQMKERLATLTPCFPDRHCESCPHAAASAATALSQTPSAPATIPVVAASITRPPVAKRDFALIQRAFMGAEVYVEGQGDRWIGIISIGGISYDGVTHESPTGFCAAFTARITEGHPRPTDPGSGWKYVKMLKGDYADKTMSEVYDALKAVAPPANQSPEAQSDQSVPDLLEEAYESADEWGSADLAAREVPEVPRNEIILPRDPGIPFVCMRNLKDALTQADISERGGTFHMHDNIWKFNSGIPDAKSPSGACCAVLKRKEGSKTNQWDGPKHILLKIDETWKPYFMVLPTSRAGGFA